jgi:hypothetical protein
VKLCSSPPVAPWLRAVAAKSAPSDEIELAVTAPAPLSDWTVSVLASPEPEIIISHSGSPPSFSAAPALATMSRMSVSYFLPSHF